MLIEKGLNHNQGLITKRVEVFTFFQLSLLFKISEGIDALVPERDQ